MEPAEKESGIESLGSLKKAFFSKNAFLQLQKLQKMRVSRVLRVLRALRALGALRALCVQWFAAVFSVVDVFESSLQIIV